MRRAIEAATRDQTRRDDSPPMQDISRARSETPFCVIVCVCGHTTSGVWDVELRSTVIEQQPAAAAPPGRVRFQPTVAGLSFRPLIWNGLGEEGDSSIFVTHCEGKAGFTLDLCDNVCACCASGMKCVVALSTLCLSDSPMS